ncbi:acetyltransferase [Agrobacterium tumefaciens]|jgi:putative colanic acid biosynthesis acetyltransferase WcaF|uniref:acetyltransferase n=1 Tax=Agrobacterium tumefaciens TaxID=358 RepID=UPI000712C542|nr:acetyltransferase [Agrobacterium tumefaciens]KQR29997.1 acetyltransferase [Rhizobium sp. Leaf155]NTA17161.1 putative colanic acid biosynthesis acetyltransferase [Agrobacterium tumefaciens]OMP71538.1 putative colanic acid biosynthesis acetyltransferase [Agrobacterium tumefaciens]WCK72488.1 putative colanic acid biosynthesis acetyltransferase [Agrobacterium tumefaciens]CVI20163.1 polysaccharide biosynthesis acetyltransferase [Agrobacterium fabacearum CFBP 5771]
MRSRYDDPAFQHATTTLPRFGGPTFALHLRLKRLVWMIVWRLLAGWTPPPMRRWRNFLLRSFGARLHATAMVHSKAIVWWPGHLVMERHSSLGPGVICYNVDMITIGQYASVSQRAHLCTGSHDVQDSAFPLVTRPVLIEEDAWVAAEAFVGPGVVVGKGAVLGARAVTAKSLEPWTIYVGNPARPVGSRRQEAAASNALSR